jgi:CRISPR-associated protein Cst1
LGDLFAFTGNPFVDGGLWGLMEWLSVKDPADIDIQQLEEVFEEITDLYTTDMWKKLMYSLFPNNKITNPAYSGREKEEYFNRTSVELKLRLW